jgi:hypothetical protein
MSRRKNSGKLNQAFNHPRHIKLLGIRNNNRDLFLPVDSLARFYKTNPGTSS